MRDGAWQDPRSVLALIDDLEMQAAGLELVERDLEVADREAVEYAALTLASRLHAQGGTRLRVSMLGGWEIHGVVRRTGPDWLLVEDDGAQEWVLRQAAVAVVRGVGRGAVSDAALGVVRRLGLRTVLRRLCDEGAECVLRLVDGSRSEGVLLRIGEDFAEARLAGADGPDLVPLAALAGVRRVSGR